MIEINLLPDIKQELIKAQRIRTTVITISILIGIISVAVVVILLMYAYGVQAVRGGILDRDIKSKNITWSDKKDLSKTLTIQNQLTIISNLDSKKKIDSRIFDVLDSIIPPSDDPNFIQISDLTIDSNENTIKINAQAKKSYVAAEIFKKTISGAHIIFNKDNEKEKTDDVLASDVSISGTSYGINATGEKVLMFTISFKYADSLFAKDSKNLKVKITNNGNVTDSYLGIPKTIFTAPIKNIEDDK